MLKNINLQLFADEDFNPMANFEDFVNEDTEGQEIEEEIIVDDEDQLEEVEEELEDLEEEPAKKDSKPNKKDATEKKKLTKQEHTIIQAKRENKTLKDALKMMEDRLASLEQEKSERGFESKKRELVSSYLEDGYEEAVATKMAEKDLKFELELTSLKKQIESVTTGAKSTYETKTQTEQEVLYKQAKAQKSRVDLADSSPSSTGSVKLTSEQKRVWEMTKKAPWGKDMTLKEFINNWDK